jgi:hypothetical protein
VGVLSRGRRFLVNRYCLFRGLSFCTKHSRCSKGLDAALGVVSLFLS